MSIRIPKSCHAVNNNNNNNNVCALSSDIPSLNLSQDTLFDAEARRTDETRLSSSGAVSVIIRPAVARSSRAATAAAPGLRWVLDDAKTLTASGKARRVHLRVESGRMGMAGPRLRGAAPLAA